MTPDPPLPWFLVDVVDGDGKVTGFAIAEGSVLTMGYEVDHRGERCTTRLPVDPPVFPRFRLFRWLP